MIDREVAIISIVFLFVLIGIYLVFFQSNSVESTLSPIVCSLHPEQSVIILPKPTTSDMYLEEAIEERRSMKIFSKGSLSLNEISQILWAGQGITDPVNDLRAAPSAGAFYPIELYLVPNNVIGAQCGIYHYEPKEHKLVLVKEGPFGAEMEKAAFGQNYVNDAAAIIIFTAVPSRTSGKYGEDGAERYINIEAGHISQNILLQATAMDLGATPIGSFSQDFVDMLMGLDGDQEKSIYMNIVGGKVS